VPNRYIKESIWTSPNLNNVSDMAERHFYRILLATDDWGGLEIDPAVLKGKCYPLKKGISEKDIAIWNQELIDNNIIRDYIKNNRLYAKFVTFEEHNDGLDRNDPKTPCPPWLLRADGIDPRLSDKTSNSFIRISEAITSLSNNGHKPTLIEIASTAKSSKTTVIRYYKKYKLGKYSNSGTDGTVGGTDA
jgi:hypothetical protein